MGVMGLMVVLSACDLTQLVIDTTATNRSYGKGPVQSIADAAEAWVGSASNTCGLETVELAAIMMTPTLLESGDSNPSPMTLSRWDNIGVNSGNTHLFAFEQPNGPYLGAFFSPGIGLWQFDSAGGWDLTAADAINVSTAGATAASNLGSRYCNTAGTPTPEQRRTNAWSAWSCNRLYLNTFRDCEGKYDSLIHVTYSTNDPAVVAWRQLDLTLNPSVSATGGMEQRTCSNRGSNATFTCWYVDPARAQGNTGWATWGNYDPSRVDGVTPLPKPFYVYRERYIDGRDYEVRVWLKADTGYDIDIKADHPVRTNARTSISWTRGAGLCDAGQRRGDCGNVNPEGSFDVVSQDQAGKVRVAGWALDGDTTDPIPVHIYVGTTGTAIMANGSRTDVGLAHPGMGDNHGFIAEVPAPTGNQTVCAYGINVGGGTTNVLLGCKNIYVTGVPKGNIDSLTVAPGSFTITGWVMVPGNGSPTADVSVDGRIVGRAARTIARADVQAKYPLAGPTAGFTGSYAISGGAHRVCLTAGLGATEDLGCRNITVPTGVPKGSLDRVTVAPGSITVSGWSFDPDTTASIPVHVYLGTSGTAIMANTSRPIVAQYFPAYGSMHGFDAVIPASAATLGTTVNVCAYGIDTNGGANTLLGCRSATLPTGAPFGSADLITRTANGVYVAGWAIDPDTSASIPVHVYVGSTGTALIAGGTRADVGGAYPLYGNGHGFSATLPIGVSPTTVCVYAIESAGTGSNRLLACRTV